MRTAFLVLVMINLMFFVWAQGYLGETSSGHEPQRLAEQMQPEALQILHQLPVAKSEDAGASTCKRIENLTPAAALAIRTEWETQAGWAVSQLPGAAVKEHWVMIPTLANEQLAEKKRSELAQLGIPDAKVIADEHDGPFVVLLASFADEPAAKRFYDTLAGKGVRSARLMPHEKAALLAIELHGPAKKIDQRIRDLALASGLTVTDCASAKASEAGTDGGAR